MLMRSPRTFRQVSRPIVFLDIDGVLTHAASDGKLDPVCVGELDRLLEATGAETVLTSSWRDTYGLLETQRRLASAGLRARIDAAAPAMRNGTRSHEITAYLRARERVRFVILDDVPVELSLRKHLVLVDDFTGLTRRDVDLALRLLA